MRPTSLWFLVILQAAVSAASLVVEIVAGRMLAPYVGMSLYTWTSVIAVVLAGFSAGHWWGGALVEKPLPKALRTTGWALLGAALTTALAAQALRLAAPPVLESAPHPVWGITALTTAAFFLPSFFAGVPAPVLTQAALVSGARQGRALGAMFASGAIGAIAGTLLAGFFFISWLGSLATLASVTVVYIVAALLCFRLAGGLGALPLAASGAAAVVAGLSLTAAPTCDVESRYFCLKTVDMSADSESPVRAMVIDHLVHGISARDLPQVAFTLHSAMLDNLAQLRAPREDFSSFFIGGGSYTVPRSFAERGLTDITVAEVDPEVTALAVRDFWFDPDSAIVLHGDARRALAGSAGPYDIIVGDAFADTAVPQHLVTREFFELVRDRLAPDGTFLMNFIDYGDRLDVAAALLATLEGVFPEVELWTEARRPEPGERVVMVLAAGKMRTAVDSFSVPAPAPTRFAALAPEFLGSLAARGQVLSDDYAPIDRLVGARD